MTSSATQTQQETQNLSALYLGTWPVERSLWHSGPSSIGGTGGSKSITQVALSFDTNGNWWLQEHHIGSIKF
jgi:hypothetical protein